MILEHAILQVNPGQSEEFIAAMQKAKPLIASQPGFQSIEIRPSSDDPARFLILVGWNDIESHRDGFRKSAEYQKWRDLLHRFYNPMPTIEYFGANLFDD